MRSRSCAAEPRLALLGERGHPLECVLGPEQPLHLARLERETVIERQLAALVHAALDRGERERRAGHEALRERPDVLGGLLGFEYAVDDPELERLLR